MPPRLWPFRKPRVPTSTPTNAATSSGSATIGLNVLPDPPTPQSPERPPREYPDYVDSDASGPRWDAPLALPSIFIDIPTLPPGLAGPLTQVADVVSSTVEAVKLMRENREECAHLVSRVVRFLRSLIDNVRASNVSFSDGTPTAASLIALKRYIFHRCCTSFTLKNVFWR